MRAALTRSANGPIDVVETADPERGSGEVLVRVLAASVNRLDLAVHRGVAMGGIARFPLIQGVDASGVIVEGTGPLIPGLRVAVKPSIACGRCRFCRAGRSGDCAEATFLGLHRPGGYAELVAVPRSNLMRIPDSVSHVEAAAAAHTHAIALRMIRSAGELAPEATVLVTGSGGALGTAAVQLASALGHRVIALASTEAKRAVAREIGADVTVDGSVTDPSRLVREQTDGAGVDLVIETTGVSAVISTGLASLGRAGRLVVVGAEPGAVIGLDVLGLYRRRHGVIGSAGSHDVDFRDTYRMLAEHDIHPVIAARYPLDRISEAMEAVGDRDRIGKVVIEMGADR